MPAGRLRGYLILNVSAGILTSYAYIAEVFLMAITKAQREAYLKTVSPASRALYTTDRVLYNIENLISIIFLVAMIIMVLYGIVMRFVFHAPNPYGEELSRYLMIYFIYIGVSMNVRFRGHLAVDSITMMLPKLGKKICAILSDLVCIFAYALSTYLSVVFIQNMLKINQNSAQMGIPMQYIYFSMTLGFALATIRSIMLFYSDHLTKERVLVVAVEHGDIEIEPEIAEINVSEKEGDEA